MLYNDIPISAAERILNSITFSSVEESFWMSESADVAGRVVGV